MKTSEPGTEKKKGKLYDIHCPSCGAPAYYDIRKHIYNCSYCGNNVGIDRAKSDRKGFREISQKKMKEALKNFELQKAVCTGCGAQIVFDRRHHEKACICVTVHTDDSGRPILSVSKMWCGTEVPIKK